MRLVAMLGGCALLAWPSSGGARGARPGILAACDFPAGDFPVCDFPVSYFRDRCPQDSPAASPPSQAAPGTAAPPADRRLKVLPRAAPRRGARPPRENRRLSPDKRRAACDPALERNRETAFNRPACQPPSPPRRNPPRPRLRRLPPPGAHPAKASTPNAQPEKSCGAEWRHQ